MRAFTPSKAHFSYSISVSVVDKTQQSDYDQASNSAHFIAVTVSRTAKVA